MWRRENQELKEQREMKHTKTEIPITKLVGNTGQIPGVPKNPRTWTQGDVMRLAKSIQETPELLELRGLIAVEHEGKYVVLGGNLRLAAGKFLNLKTMPVEVVEDCTTAKMKEIAIKDNGAFGQWDASALLEEWGDSPLGEWGVVKDNPLADDKNYKKFVEKFQPKKTTDDCYTPPAVYDAVCDYLEEEYHLNRADFVRPFVPGGDYKAYKYPKNAVVVDNPPFSIMAEIVSFYKSRGIPFFLFCQSQTSFNHCVKACVVCACVAIVYDNGAIVNTSFLSGLPKDRGLLAKSSPRLWELITEAQKKEVMDNPKYDTHLIIFSHLGTFSRFGVSFEISEGQGIYRKKVGDRPIFGGILLSDQKEAERLKAEEEAEWRRMEEESERRKAPKPQIDLSAEDLEIIKKLSE